MDVFKANENKQLKDRIAQLEAMLTPEQAQIDDLQNKSREEVFSEVITALQEMG